MNRCTAIIVDDEPTGQVSMQKLLQWNCPEVDIIGLCSGANEAIQKIRLEKPDLVFLDIAMPGKNAFEMLNEFSTIPFEIIFVTAYHQYMTQAFKFSAVDYLLKPVDEDLLVEAVKRARDRIGMKTGSQQLETFLYNFQNQQQSQKLKLCIPSMKGFQIVYLNDILYLEADSAYTNFHFFDRPIICASKTIHEYETLLEDAGFLRIHKSYVVNMEYIKEYVRGEGGSVILKDGTEIEVSRRKKEMLINKMKEHFKF
jgi:two-component system LytT family response regulator